jgi:hypothetical protein
MLNPPRLSNSREPKYAAAVSDRGGPAPNASTTSQPIPDPVPSQPETPRFVLFNDIPAEYQSDPTESRDLRPQFFRGFMTGSLVSALAIAALFFAYGRQINDALAQLRGNVGNKPALEGVQGPANRSANQTPPVSQASPVALPLVAFPDSQTASDAQATATARAASEEDPVATDLPKARDDLRRMIAPTGSVSGDSKTLASRNRAPVGALDDTGEKELAIAQGYLRNRGGVADGAAATFLWSAVEKGSVAAEVTLAELYAHGDGVTRSCDQARVLLYAAASKGNAEADRELSQIASGGCN